MDILSAVLFGIIQGATEFLPVSSSAHLALCHSFFGLVPADAYPGFDVMLHLGTLIAVFIAYRADMPGVCKGCFTSVPKLFKNRFSLEKLDINERIAVFTVIVTVPAVIFTLLGGADISDNIALYPGYIGALLIFNGVLLILTDMIKTEKYTVSDVKYRHALTAGLFEAIAVLPGISRSGATVFAGRLCGIKKFDAVKLSFISSVPAILGAVVLKAPDVARASLSLNSAAVYTVGCLTAAAAGLCAIKLIKFISDRSKFRYFSFYCFALGAYAIYRTMKG